MDKEKSLKTDVIACDLDEASRIIGIGKTKLYEEINAGRLKAKKFGRRTLIPIQALQDWFENLKYF